MGANAGPISWTLLPNSSTAAFVHYRKLILIIVEAWCMSASKRHAARSATLEIARSITFFRFPWSLSHSRKYLRIKVVVFRRLIDVTHFGQSCYLENENAYCSSKRSPATAGKLTLYSVLIRPYTHTSLETEVLCDWRVAVVPSKTVFLNIPLLIAVRCIWNRKSFKCSSHSTPMYPQSHYSLCTKINIGKYLTFCTTIYMWYLTGCDKSSSPTRAISCTDNQDPD